MKTNLLILLSLSLLAAPACALNVMTLVGQYQGEATGNGYGAVVTMGDFDADGHEEFFVAAPTWGFAGYNGKNYFYDWNGDWPQETSWTFQGNQPNHDYDQWDQNVGDVNGDGVVDLGLSEENAYDARFDLFFGGSNFDSLPDWSFFEPPLIMQLGFSLDSCGDVNGDGGHDFALGVYDYNDGFQTRIYFGGNALDTIPDWTYTTTGQRFMSGLGDVNGDGFGDLLSWDPAYPYEPAYLFFGGNPMDTIPDLIFYNFAYSGGATGDINADGYNDFCLQLWLPDSTVSPGYIYFGGPNVNNVPDVILQNRLGQDWGFGKVCGGDFNGDGITDLATQSGDMAFGNVIYIYLGSPWFNPVPDAIIGSWTVYDDYGKALAAGDLNGDGRDELIVGSPGWPSGFDQGRAYLYTGPQEWIDYGAVVEPEDLQHYPGWFRLDQNYPNPFNAATSIHFELGKPSTVELSVYDVQGNMIKRLIFPRQMVPGGYNVSWAGRNEAHEPTSSGIYLIALKVDQYQQVKKMALLR